MFKVHFYRNKFMIYLTRIRARKEMMKILVSIKNYRRKIINHEQKTQNILEATNKKNIHIF